VPRDYQEVKADSPSQIEGDSATGEMTETDPPADPGGTEPAAAAAEPAGPAGAAD
jgi:hypothetical protein